MLTPKRCGRIAMAANRRNKSGGMRGTGHPPETNSWRSGTSGIRCLGSAVREVEEAVPSGMRGQGTEVRECDERGNQEL
jgi:hypothetical protein